MPANADRRLLQADVEEHDLPGIGVRYELDALEGGTACVVVHHSGRRDVYVVPRGGGDPRAALTLTDAQARVLGAVLSGAYFRPAVVEDIEAVVGTLLIDWVTIGEASPAAGRSIAEMEIRRRTKMTVAAILRGTEPIVAPEPTEVLQAGDRLVIVGRQEDLPAFVRHVVGDDSAAAEGEQSVESTHQQGDDSAAAEGEQSVESTHQRRDVRRSGRTR
jgi:TrkA domain protein